jgi:hypothetical protein
MAATAKGICSDRKFPAPLFQQCENARSRSQSDGCDVDDQAQVLQDHMAADGNLPKVGRRARNHPKARPDKSAPALPNESDAPAKGTVTIPIRVPMPSPPPR